MALCVSMLIAAEFMPVSLLTPIARDLRATEGMAGQAISISGLFALVASLLIATVAGRYNRRPVLLGLTGVMLASLILIAVAPNFLALMIARALLGVVVGGFWSLSTATVMRLVPEENVPKALGIIYTGLAVASAFAAPIGSYAGGIIGWRGVFWAMTPLAVVTLFWQWLSLPSMEPQTTNPVGKLFGLLKRRHIAFGMAGVMLTYAGVFASFTYLRAFLESYTRVSLPQLSLLLLGLGLTGFAGTYGASALVGRHLFFAPVRAACGVGSSDDRAAGSRPLALGRSCHDGCVGYAELCNPGSLVYLVVQRHQRRARKRRGPYGGDDSTRHHAGRGFRGTVARPSFDCGNVHWKRCFAGDRFSCRRRCSSAQRLKA